jgi:predicted  nucleic acid-binding Zn-ribbon protein
MAKSNHSGNKISSSWNDPIEIEITDIGGIRHESQKIPPGITTLVGENASNRSSFLAALMAVLGSTNSGVITPNTNGETGHVEAAIGDETYTRTVESTPLSNQGESIVFSGEPVVADNNDAELLDLYAFLHGENEVRRVIEQNGDIYDILMQPVDTDAIETEIKDLTQEISKLENELTTITNAKERKKDLELELRQKEDELEQLEPELEELETKCSELEDELPSDDEDEATEKANKIEKQLSELEREKETKNQQLRRKNRQLESAKTELAETKSNPDTSIEELEDARSSLQDELNEIEDQLRTRRTLKSYINDLHARVRELQEQEDQFEEIAAVLPNESLPVGPLALKPRTRSNDPTAALVEQEQECHVCGSTFDDGQLDAVLEQYSELQQALQSEIESVRSQKGNLESQLEEQTKQLGTLRTEQETIRQAKDQISRLKPEIQRLEERVGELTNEIDTLEEERAAITIESNNEVVRQYHDARDELRVKKSSRSRVTSDIERLEDEIANLTETIEREPTVKTDLEQAREQREELRNEVERIETALVEEFNSTMDTIVARLGFENIERVWLERRETEVKNGRRKVDRTVFDLHVIREGDGGVYEGRIEHLSESERATVGVVLAVAGYVVHNVAEICPVMLLDSIEMMDSSRIASLLDFLTDTATITWIIAALLPDHETSQTRDVVNQKVAFETTGEATI